jgi:HPt (histidine-containing phosphotransfer) domain-containing protein
MSDSVILDPTALSRLREWGGEKLLTQMVRLFLDNSAARVEQIRTGVQGGDAKEAEKGAHSLKSSAANVGAERLRGIAAAIEQRASAGQSAELASLLPDLESAYALTRAALEDIEPGPEP